MPHESMTWALMILLAEAERRGDIVAYVEGKPYSNNRHLRLTDRRVEGALREVMEAERHPGNMAEIAELASVRLAEFAQSVEREPPPRPAALDKTCVICRATRDEWCVPVHAGERGDRGWCHPDRGKPLTDQQIEAIELAVATLKLPNHYGNISKYTDGQRQWSQVYTATGTSTHALAHALLSRFGVTPTPAERVERRAFEPAGTVTAMFEADAAHVLYPNAPVTFTHSGAMRLAEPGDSVIGRVIGVNSDGTVLVRQDVQ